MAKLTIDGDDIAEISEATAAELRQRRRTGIGRERGPDNFQTLAGGALPRPPTKPPVLVHLVLEFPQAN